MERFNLKRKTLNRWPYKFGQRYWLRYYAMLAPYWSMVDCHSSFINGPSKVFYHVYCDTKSGSNAVLIKATNDVTRLYPRPLPTKFKASWVLVVTWLKLRPLGLNLASPNLVRSAHACSFLRYMLT